ncbi:MAG: hypothetical protein Q8R07_05325 [Candidatus Uhrbacteria bacterium]|nr:hypothetical protein [Candidatus Uhrbacteria bacterium]
MENLDADRVRTGAPVVVEDDQKFASMRHLSPFYVELQVILRAFAEGFVPIRQDTDKRTRRVREADLHQNTRPFGDDLDRHHRSTREHENQFRLFRIIDTEHLIPQARCLDHGEHEPLAHFSPKLRVCNVVDVFVILLSHVNVLLS